MIIYVDAKTAKDAIEKTGFDSATEVDNGAGGKGMKRWACFEFASDREMWDKNVAEAAGALGRRKSAKKAAASRANAKLGGAPKLCTCGHKRNHHCQVSDFFGRCVDRGCGCQSYHARE